MTNTKQILVEVPAELHKAFKIKTICNNTTMTKALHDLIKAYCQLPQH